MEDGLVQTVLDGYRKMFDSLNPCCDGRWSRTRSRTSSCLMTIVLILVVMEDGLVHLEAVCSLRERGVLILVVMEDGLVLIQEGNVNVEGTES